MGSLEVGNPVVGTVQVGNPEEGINLVEGIVLVDTDSLVVEGIPKVGIKVIEGNLVGHIQVEVGTTIDLVVLE